MTSLEKTTLGMGCFWNSEKTLANTKGIKVTEVGFMGRNQVEVVRLQFDPEEIRYDQILALFFTNHDASVLEGNEQSVIFYHTPQQKRTAEQSRANYRALLETPINTEITHVSPIYEKADEKYQGYLQKNSS